VKSFWDCKFNFPCVRVAVNRYRLYNDVEEHARQGTLLLYLSCRRRGQRFLWRFVNLETGEQSQVTSKGWDPEKLLNEVSMSIERATVTLDDGREFL